MRLPFALKQPSAGGFGLSHTVSTKEEPVEQDQTPQQAGQDFWTTEAGQDIWAAEAIEAKPNDPWNGSVESNDPWNPSVEANTPGEKRPWSDYSRSFEDARWATKKFKKEPPVRQSPGALPEPPLLAPLVQAIAAASANFNITNESIAVTFQRLLAARNECATFAGQQEDMPVTTRRRALHRVLYDRLWCMGDEAMPLQQLALDPVITALRRGVAKSIQPILQEKPECYQVIEEANSKGRMVQAVRLLAGGQQEMGAEAPGTPELLMQRLVAGLQAHGGYAPVSQLGQDPEIKESLRGVASKLTKFLEKHPRVFQVGPDGETGVLTVSLLSIPWEAGPAVLSAPVPAQDGQRVLMEQIASVIAGNGGSCSMSALGCHPGIKEHRKGVAANLNKFLESYPDIFEKVGDSSSGNTAWSLVNGWNASPSFAGGWRPDANPAKTPEEKEGDAESARQEVVRFLQARGGEAPLQKLGEDSSIRQTLKGVAAKISKFLHQHPETFEVVFAGDPAVLTCRLVNTFG